MTEEWFEYEIPLEDFSKIESDVDDFLEAEGWQEGCSPRTYVEPQLVDYEYDSSYGLI